MIQLFISLFSEAHIIEFVEAFNKFDEGQTGLVSTKQLGNLLREAFQKKHWQTSSIIIFSIVKIQIFSAFLVKASTRHLGINPTKEELQVCISTKRKIIQSIYSNEGFDNSNWSSCYGIPKIARSSWHDVTHHNGKKLWCPNWRCIQMFW